MLTLTGELIVLVNARRKKVDTSWRISHLILKHVTAAAHAATCAMKFFSRDLNSRQTTTRPEKSALKFNMLSRSMFRGLALRPMFRAGLTTQPSSTNPNPETPLRASPRAEYNEPQQQQQQSSTREAEAAVPQTPRTRNHIPLNKQPLPPTFTTPLKVTQTLLDTLPHMTAQKTHYITAHLHAKPYLLTTGDQLRLPFHMSGVQAGDVIRLNRASVLGSRDFTLKGTPYVDERLFECRARVLGVDAEPMRIKEKTKRRQRHVKTARSKHRFTVLRVMDVRVKDVEELVDQGAVVEST